MLWRLTIYRHTVQLHWNNPLMVYGPVNIFPAIEVASHRFVEGFAAVAVVAGIVVLPTFLELMLLVVFRVAYF